MAVTSDNVAPKKRSAKPEPELKSDINMAVNDPKAELMEAVQNYEEKVKKVAGGKVLLKMERENISFVTPGGVVFSKDNPFQLVEEWEVDELIRQNFRKAFPEEVKEFYSNE